MATAIATDNNHLQDERTPLLGGTRSVNSTEVDADRDVESGHSTRDASPMPKVQNMALIIPFLMLGVFVANVDGSIVMATVTTIGSAFGELSGASWLITSYFLGLCAVQPLIGKLSDIYGRKEMLILVYIIFAIGTLLSGISKTYWQMIIGRVVTGFGSAGMTSLVSILITDMVPLRNVAFWRSFVYMAASIGRSSGAPLGGILSDSIGWRWSFTGQSPFALATLLLVWKVLKVPARQQRTSRDSSRDSSPFKGRSRHEDSVVSSRTAKFRRIDFAGALTLACAIVSFLLVIDLGAGLKFPFNHPYIISSLIVFVLATSAFLWVELKWAVEPIFPLRLLSSRDVIAPYMVECMLSAAQLAMLSNVALYFRVTAKASNLVAALHLLPSNVGYIIGSFATGLIIRKTGRYKSLTVFATLMWMLCSILLITRWRGDTSWWESMFILPGGFSCGIGTAATFVALTAALDPADMAVAGSGFYLSDNLGIVAGVSVAAGVVQGSLRTLLPRALQGIDGKEQIIEKVLHSVEDIWSLSPEAKPLVVSSYVKALEYSHYVSLIASIIALICALLLREHKMQ